MLKWSDLEAIGAHTPWPAGELAFEAPEHVHGIIRQAIHERVSRVTDPDLSSVASCNVDGICGTCGDPMTKRLGWCCLCAAAWKVAVRDGFAWTIGEDMAAFRLRWAERRALVPALPPVPVWPSRAA